jgi:hypothetical protein
MADWITLGEAVKRAERWGVARLEPFLCRKRVQITAKRRFDEPPDRVEELLADASCVTIMPNNQIRVYGRFSVLGWDDLDETRLRWPQLTAELEAAGFSEFPAKIDVDVAVVRRRPIPTSVLRKHLMDIKTEGRMPSADTLYIEIARSPDFSKYRVSRNKVRTIHKQVWGPQRPGRRGGITP